MLAHIDKDREAPLCRFERLAEFNPRGCRGILSNLDETPVWCHRQILIPILEDDTDIEAMLAIVYNAIFEAELENWHLIEANWPTNRTFAMFQEWLDVEVHSLVSDLYDAPLLMMSFRNT